MDRLHVKYLLIGAGVASGAAAQAIRRRDPEGSVLLVGQEINRPYHRPPLSRGYLRGQAAQHELFSLDAEWCVAHHVELRTGRRAAHLDTARRAVTLDDGLTVSFDNLLIATGASARHLKLPGAELPNVYYLRTLADADRLHNAIDKARHEGRPHPRGRGKAAVIGGGVLGVELAGTLTQLGLHVDLLISHRQPWERFAGENTGRFLARYLEKHGVSVHLEQRPERLEGDGRVQRIVLSSGHTTECDLVVAAVGVQVSKDLLRGTPITAEKAVLVDDHCRTNLPGIYAAGDCAAVFDPLFGKHRHIDHWDNALLTGTLAGANMAGGDEAYSAVSHFSSEVFGLTMSAWGEPRHVERRLLRGNPNDIDQPGFAEIGVRNDGRVSQVIAVGQVSQAELLQELVRRRLRVEGIEETLKEPTSELAALLA